MTNQSEKYNKFFEWIRSNGGYIDPDIYIYENENGSNQRVVKTRVKKVNTEVMSIPQKCCMLNFEKNNIEIMKTMLKELQNPNSFYKPYLDILPSFESFKNHPFLIFNEDDILPIKEICYEASVHLEKLFICFDIAKKELKCSEELAKYVFLLYITRSWSTGFMPLIDMMQHSNLRCNVKEFRYDKNEKNENLKIETDVCEDELINCYRDASFIELFLFYEIPFGSNEDLVKIHFNTTYLTKEQKSYLSENGLYTEPMYMYFNNSIVLSTLEKAKILVIENKNDEKIFIKDRLQNDKDAVKYIFSIIYQSLENEITNIPEKYKIFQHMTKIKNRILNLSKTSYIEYWANYITETGSYIKIPSSLQLSRKKLKIDHTYICHYSKLTDRKACLMEQIEIHRLNDLAPITWVDFFDREILTPKQIEENVLKREGEKPLIVLAHVGTALSHHYALEKIAFDDNIHIGMIIEDDVILKNNFVDNLNREMKKLPNDWDVLVVGCHWLSGPDSCVMSEKFELVNENTPIYKPQLHTIITAHYIVNKQGAKKIVKDPMYKPFYVPIDETLTNISRKLKLNVYWCRPFLSIEGSQKGYYKLSYTPVERF